MKHVDPVKEKGTKRVHRRPNYLLVFAALAVLTALEVLVTYIPGIPLAPVLLTMSIAKVLLVILYFMHLRFDNRWFSFIFFAPFLLVIPLLIVLRL
jgi:cytochrome c oxidase subunit IV